MKNNRVRTQGKLGHERRQHSGNSNNNKAAISRDNKTHNAQQQNPNHAVNSTIPNNPITIASTTSNHHYHQTSNQLIIDTASNNELKEIISKLISKSRSLIESLEKTLKELDIVRGEKEFWKGHYFSFKTACERYVRSRGIQPFQYNNFVDGVFGDSACVRLSPQQQLQQHNDSHYRSSSLNNSSNNYKPVYYFNNTLTTSPVREIKEVSNLNSNSNKIPSAGKNPSQAKQQSASPSTMIKTVVKVVDEDKTQQMHDQTVHKFDHSFKGIKLGKGKNIMETKKSPLKLHIYDTRSKNNSNYRRKDSLQTKRVELFSFVRNRNHETHESFQSVEMKVS